MCRTGLTRLVKQNRALHSKGSGQTKQSVTEQEVICEDRGECRVPKSVGSDRAVHKLPVSPTFVHRLCATTDSENSSIGNCTERYSSEFKNNCFTEMRSGSAEGSHFRLMDGCITQL